MRWRGILGKEWGSTGWEDRILYYNQLLIVWFAHYDCAQVVLNVHLCKLNARLANPLHPCACSQISKTDALPEAVYRFAHVESHSHSMKPREKQDGRARPPVPVHVSTTSGVKLWV